MKKKFKGFYNPKDDDNKSIWNSKNTLFVFDANCLLNLYRCDTQTRDDIFTVMKKISDRSWFPFQTCFEYQRNRITVINENVQRIIGIKKTLTSIGIKADTALSENNVKTQLYTRLAEELSSFKEKINKPLNEFIENNIEPRLKIAIEISKRDNIREEIDAIVGDNCGDLPTQEMINSINTDGDARYKNEIAPGFRDNDKIATSNYSGVTFTDKYGDLYLWKEIIEKAKNDDIKNVIFITDDKKADWWFIPEKNKPKGPLECLQTEIYNHSDIDSFKLLNQSSFLYEASKYLKNIHIQNSSVEEIQAIQIESLEKDVEILSFNDIHQPKLSRDLDLENSIRWHDFFNNNSKYSITPYATNTEIDYSRDDNSFTYDYVNIVAFYKEASSELSYLSDVFENSHIHQIDFELSINERNLNSSKVAHFKATRSLLIRNLSFLLEIIENPHQVNNEIVKLKISEINRSLKRCRSIIKNL